LAPDFDSELRWLSALPSEERLLFLARLSHALTVAFRVALLANAEQSNFISSLRELNEAQHQVTGYVSYCLRKKERVSFLDSVIASVRRASTGELSLQVDNAWRTARQA